MSTSAKVMDVLERIAKTDQVRLNQDLALFDEGVLDSFGMVKLMVALSEAFGVEISPAEIEREQWASPRKIIAYMNSPCRTMKTVHLSAALASVALMMAVMAAGAKYARSIEVHHVHSLLTPKDHRINLTGSALQKVAFQQPDLLPIYGASEMRDSPPSSCEAEKFFQAYPTGFMTFVVAFKGVMSITMAQSIAALGSDLNGKKVVISFTPAQFTEKAMGQKEYNGLFSRLHAYELVFSTALSLEVKQAAACRMRDYPDTLKKDRLLDFAVANLASRTPHNRIFYYAAWPLGKLQTWVIELQDHWETMDFIRRKITWRKPVARHPATLDWNALAANAEKEQLRHMNDADNDYVDWAETHPRFKFKPGGDTDQEFLDSLNTSKEWSDMDILLSILQELHAKPLLLGRPMNRAFGEAVGISGQTQHMFYDKIRRLAARHDVPVIDFEGHETDQYFNADNWQHTSTKGWIYVDQALDAFYHGTMSQLMD